MKKENKEIAKQRRAKQRAKESRQNRIIDFIRNWGPAILIVLVAVFMVVAIAFSGDNGESDESVEDESEVGFSLDGADGDEILEWEEVDGSEGAGGSEELDTTPGTKVENGDTVDIDFKGTVDGKAFEGGDTEGGGYELTLGSGEFIDGFEEAIAGHAVGETFDVKVTFPDPYLNDPSLSGKEAVFQTTINGVYR